MLRWPWRKGKNNQRISDLGLRPLMDEFQNLRRRFKKAQRQTRTIVVVRKDITSLVNIVISIAMLGAGLGLGIWYRGNSGGGGDAIKTVKEKIVPPAQEILKQAAAKTPPEKRPVVLPTPVEPRAVVIAPARVETASAVLQKPAVPQKPPEPMSAAKRLLIRLEGKLTQE